MTKGLANSPQEDPIKMFSDIDNEIGRTTLGSEVWDKLTPWQKMCEIATIREYLRNSPFSIF